MQKDTASFKISPRILDHLGISAYNSLKKCLAELCTNSYDADASVVNITIPEIIDENSVIFIEDNGVGMSKDELKEKYLFIGYNRRSQGEKTIEGRDVIGSKGIGKLAGFGIAENLKIVTWKDSVKYFV